MPTTHTRMDFTKNYAIIQPDQDETSTEIQWGEYVNAEVLPYMISNGCTVVAIYSDTELMYSEMDEEDLLEVVHESRSRILTEKLIEEYFYNEDYERDNKEGEHYDMKMDADKLGE